MIEYLNWIDHKFFIWVQTTLRSDFFDPIFLALRDKYFWYPLYLFLLCWLILQFKFSSIKWLLAIIFLVAVSDQLCSNVLKKQIRRSRPCAEEFFKDQFTPVIGCSRGFSLPSCHATNHMSVGAFIFFALASRLPRGKWFFLFWSIPIGIAQVYIGVHFPFDVLAGWAVGLGVAYAYHKVIVRFNGLPA